MKNKSIQFLPALISGSVLLLVCVLQVCPQLGMPAQRWWSIPFDFPPRLEWITYDWRVRLATKFPRPTCTNLAAVLITDDDIRNMNKGQFGYYEKFPWPTHLYGRAVRALSTQEVQAVGFDILFDQLNPTERIPEDPNSASDDFFASSLRDSGRVILAAESAGDAFPHPLFATNALRLANISAEKDSDGVLRRVKAFAEYRVWHPFILSRAGPLNLVLDKAEITTDRLIIPLRFEGGPWELKLTPDGCLDSDEVEELDGVRPLKPEPPFRIERLWNLGIALAAAHLGLDLSQAEVAPNQIILRGSGGLERRIPIDPHGFFLIDWALQWNDPRLQKETIVSLIREYDQAGVQATAFEIGGEERFQFRRHESSQEDQNRFRGKIVVVGSVGIGNNIADLGATPLSEKTPLVSKHWNVANSIIQNQFIHRSSPMTELGFLLFLGLVSSVLTWRMKVVSATLWTVCLAFGVFLLGAFLYLQYRYWLPLFLPIAGGLFAPHFSLITYRVIFQERESRRIKGVFTKMVSPDVVNELLNAETISLSGARREATVFFADVRGFTEFTDNTQVNAEEHIRQWQLKEKEAEEYFDSRARETLETVNRYLGSIAEVIKNHRGTLDKYMGDCVMAFWGAPVPNERHALSCVLAAIEAQRAIHALNQQRLADNERRSIENEKRAAAGQPLLPVLPVLSLGTGINTGKVIVGLMGSDVHGLNYTVFGRDVNLASRLEGVSGRARIIISENTLVHLKRDEPELASRCLELSPVTVKGIRQPVKIFEVPWQTLEEKQPSPSLEPPSRSGQPGEIFAGKHLG